MTERDNLPTSSKDLCEIVTKGMLEKKASDIVVMDLKNIKHAVADYFILCSGSSDTQIDAISDSIEEMVRKETKQKPWKTEGRSNREWILIDYVDVVAHVFNKDKRVFYALEELWGDAKITSMESQN